MALREEFRADLHIVSQLLVDMAEAVRTAMSEATRALLHADRAAGEDVIARDAEVDTLYRQVEDRVTDLMARHESLRMRFPGGAPTGCGNDLKWVTRASMSRGPTWTS